MQLAVEVRVGRVGPARHYDLADNATKHVEARCKRKGKMLEEGADRTCGKASEYAEQKQQLQSLRQGLLGKQVRLNSICTERAQEAQLPQQHRFGRTPIQSAQIT